MPNIKRKPFQSVATVLCYKCGVEIKNGTLNWSYNTRQAGMFSHLRCDDLNYDPTLDPAPTAPTAEPIPTIITKYVHSNFVPLTSLTGVTTKVNVTQVYADITDRITIDDSKHFQTEKIKLLLKIRQNPFLYGAPGAGKSFLAAQLAKDMGLDFLMISCSNDMFKSEIMGSISPVNGSYLVTQFYHVFSNGGLVLFDEAGLASGAFLNVLNNALANKELRFPNRERIKLHVNCFIMFADNSNLRGNDPDFPERQDSGGAFRDRLAYMEFFYDEKLESSIASKINPISADTVCRKMKLLRTALKASPVSGIFASPRVTFKTAEAMNVGFAFDECMEMYLRAGLDIDNWSIVKSIIARIY